MPKYVDHTVETFVAAIKRDFENSTLKKQPKDNLTPGERNTSHDLQMRDDIIITKADKGGATVIWDVKDYLKQAEKQLHNQTYYRKSEICPTEEHTRLTENNLDEFVYNRDISEAIAEGLKPSNPKTPRFYMLPKTHKNGNQGRPVVSLIKVTPAKFPNMLTTIFSHWPKI